MARPRTTSFSPEEMILLGEEMVAWIKARPETLHLSQWYTIEKMFTYNEWKGFINRKEFIPYYELALKLVGVNYLTKDSKVRDGISQRWQRVYFKDLKEQEDEDAKFNSELKKEENKVIDQAFTDKADAIFEQMKNAQSSACKIAESNNIKE